MRHTLFTIGIGALAFGGLVTISGTSVGGGVGTTAAATGVLVVVAALYLMAIFAIRQRVWQRLEAPVAQRTHASRVAGRRVF